MSFTSPTATASVAFRPNGIYYGIVTAVYENTRRVDVEINRLNIISTNLQVLSVNLPSVGQLVGCVFAENRSDELLVIGPIQQSGSLRYAPPVICTSSTRPASGQVPAGTFIYETDTSRTLVWSGSAWVGVTTGGNFSSQNVTINSNGIGIGSASIRPPLVITSTYDPIQSTAITNASAGAIQIGAVNSTNMVIDHNSLQARNNGSTAKLVINPKGGEVEIGGTLTIAGGLNAGSLTTGTVPSGRLTGAYTGISSLGQLTTIRIGNWQISQSNQEVVSNYFINGNTAQDLFRVQGQVFSSANYSWLAFRSGMKIGQYNRGTPSNATGGNAENWSGIFFTSSTDNSLSANTAATFYPGIMSSASTNDVIISCKPSGSVKIRPNGNTGGQGLEITQSGQPHNLTGLLNLRRRDALKAGALIYSEANTEIGGLLANNDNTGVGINDLSYGLWATGASNWTITVQRDGQTTLGSATTQTFLSTSNIGGTPPFQEVGISSVGQLVRHDSLAEYKENINYITNALTEISNLKPRSFTFNPEKFDVSEENHDYYRLDQRFGFIVEELIEDSPNFVTYRAPENADENISNWEPSYWRTHDMIALLTAGIQEMKETIDQLEQRIADLES
jgi:hypothetical protein